MPPLDPLEVEKLTKVSLETKERLKIRMQEEGPNEIPPLLVMVKVGEKDLGDGVSEAVYAGLTIDPERKEEALQEIFQRFPDVRVFTTIIHANVWIGDKDSTENFEDYQELKKHVPRQDGLIVTLVYPDGTAKILSMETYQTVDGKLVWKEEKDGYEVPKRGVNPAYHLPLTEEDFE